MLDKLNKWQHQLFVTYLHLPEGAEPLQNQPLHNRSLHNHSLPNRPLTNAYARKVHARKHEPQVLKEWQQSIANFVEQYLTDK